MKLFITNLSYTVTEGELRNVFKSYNPASAEIIKDRNTGKSRGLAKVEIEDEDKAKKALREMNGKNLKGRVIAVRIDNKDIAPGEGRGRDRERPSRDSHTDTHDVAGDGASPYDFCKRKTGKKAPDAFHEELLENHYDVAFDIVWKTLTPTAVNPCSDEGPECCPPCLNNKKEYAGYDRQWLVVDNRLAISPFTVKSAIANGFANILGGCYRVNTKKGGQGDDIEEGTYPYSGEYKRYRVARDGSSKPGLVKNLSILENGDREFIIQPVEEFYCNDNLPLTLKKGDEVLALKTQDRGFKPHIIKVLEGNNVPPSSNVLKVKYDGPYKYGMNLDGEKPERKHKHRFYIEKNEAQFTSTIKAVNFFTNKENLQKIVYTGKWYENLTKVQKDDIVYYEAFNCSVTNIGLNFLFKPLFLHEDTVPEGNSQCNDVKELCPRCSMFGMTASNDEKEINGFKGRFKSATLTTEPFVIEKLSTKAQIPYWKNDGMNTDEVDLKQWKADNNTICQQTLLPILGPPKPNKRDIDGYFNKETGMIKGAKYYLHGSKEIGDLKRLGQLMEKTNGKIEPIEKIDERTGKTNREFKYAHEMRNYALACKEGMEFSGTVGAENCTLEEIAALLILLHSDMASHGFKIGLGKPLGMGSVKSRIKRVWVRNKETYETWKPIDIAETDKQSLTKTLELDLKGISGVLDRIVRVDGFVRKINCTRGMDQRVLKYPETLRDYWDEFKKNRSRPV